MAETSSYSIEERLVASVWVHKRQHTGQTMSQVIAAFRERFNKAPPPNQFKIYIESEVRIFWVYGDFSTTLYIYYIIIVYTPNVQVHIPQLT